MNRSTPRISAGWRRPGTQGRRSRREGRAPMRRLQNDRSREPRA